MIDIRIKIFMLVISMQKIKLPHLRYVCIYSMLYRIHMLRDMFKKVPKTSEAFAKPKVKV